MPFIKLKSSLRNFKRLSVFTQNCLWKYNQTPELMGEAGEAIAQVTDPDIKLNQAMAYLSGIAGKDSERLKKISRHTGVSSGLEATGATNAFTCFTEQYFKNRDGRVARQKITLAQASEMSTTEAANSMTETINQFDLQASDTSQIGKCTCRWWDHATKKNIPETYDAGIKGNGNAVIWEKVKNEATGKRGGKGMIND